MTEASPKKKLYVKTFGCQMNVYDSARMRDALGEGYTATDSPEDADLVLLNTCHIREKAAEKLYSELGRLRDLREARRDADPDQSPMLIGVAGCVAQAEGAEIVRRQPAVDFVVGPQAYHRLPALERAARAGGQDALVDTEFPVEDKFAALPKKQIGQRGPSVFLTVQEGCDKFCAFCVVPYTRGAEQSRPAAALLDEARGLVEGGAREIVLLGQNVNAYHGVGPDGREWGLARLIRELATIDGLARIRYTTSHPNDMDEELIIAHGEAPKLMPYLHLPVQAGSDRILKAMNRRHTAEGYLRLIERIRAVRPDIAMSGDFIVGFPGETEADFEATLALTREVGYASAYSFKYSPRPGTPAAGAEQIPEAVKSERLARLQELLSAQMQAFNAASLGAATEILLERPGREPGQMIGRTPWLQSAHVEAPEARRGEILKVRIDSVGPNSVSASRL